MEFECEMSRRAGPSEALRHWTGGEAAYPPERGGEPEHVVPALSPSARSVRTCLTVFVSVGFCRLFTNRSVLGGSWEFAKALTRSWLGLTGSLIPLPWGTLMGQLASPPFVVELQL